jgi:hypothetical protein
MGAEQRRHAAEPMANEEWWFARRRVRTGRVAPASASTQASRPLVHSVTGAGLGLLGFRRLGVRTRAGYARPTWRRADDIVRGSADIQDSFV